ncbi:MAG TPA: hypothetical protein DF715_05030, partial [Oceanicaulis sp.]|nr:hypothetical protein [Oceanicaulis sp.]
ADTLEAARKQADHVEMMLRDMRSRFDDAPAAARRATLELERALSEGLAKLNQTAEEASESAREIDAMFQARVRHNYELLSDFMLRMGSVAGGRKPIDIAPDEVPDPLNVRRRPARPSTPVDEDEVRLDARDQVTDDENESSPPERPRDERLATQARPEGGWRWKDLLANMDPDEDDEPPSGGTAKRGKRRD